MTNDEPKHVLGEGDRQALGALFDRYYGEAFGYAERMLGDSHAAADAVQDAFLRVLRYGESFDGRGTFRRWILRVTRNVCLDMVADSRRRREREETLPRIEAVQPADIPDPRLAVLRAAVEALPVDRRDVLILRRFHGLSYAEIGEIVGISEGAARVRAHRALAQLRDELAPILEKYQ